MRGPNTRTVPSQVPADLRAAVALYSDHPIPTADAVQTEPAAQPVGA
jgi:hypothetical protein